MRSGALVAVLAVAMTALAAPVIAQAPAKVPAAQQDTKRCQAAQRRVERQKQVLDQHNARASKDADARARCTSKRNCSRLDRALIAHDTRRKTYERQLSQYEADARRLCIS
jgi:hypothetical protein